jgi:uncharacterized LabA/DUF88 family protein
MIQRPHQRLSIFIDTQNLYHSAKHLYNARVNFPALVDTLAAGRNLIRAIAYVAKSKTGEEAGFFEALTQNGIELKVKDVQEFSSGAKKADWDVGMTVDAIAMSPRVDVVVLVTGDGDFTPLVEYLHAHGCRCEVAAFGRSTNAHLKEIADSFLDISENPDPYLIRHGSRFEYTPPAPPSLAKALALEETPEDKKSDGRSTKRGAKPSSPRRGGESTGPGSRKIRITY